jgi:hypothetical protein
MKKILRFSVLLLAAGLVLGLAGCPNEDDGNGGGGGGEYDQYYDGTFRNNRNGTVEVVNNTSHNMLLFSGETISLNYIVGGVRAYSTNTVNFSTESDYTVGSYKVIHAVKEGEFDTYGQNSKVDHSAMVTYRDGTKFRTNIVSTTDGAFQFTVNNKNTQYALELRKNTPEGEKVAYLTKAEQRRVIKSPSNAQMTLFPVWIAYNNATKSIVSFAPSDYGDIWEGWRDVSPRSPRDDVSPYDFPDGNIDINFPNVQFPFATVQVRNNATRDINFRIANRILPAQSDYVSIPSGFSDTYELDGEDLDLNISMQNGSMVIKVRFENAPGASSVTIEQGYVYNVVLNIKPGEDPSQVSSYEAWLVKGAELKKSDLLTSG